MDLALAILALPFGGTLLAVFVGACMNALFREGPARPTRAGLSAFLREWMASLIMAPLVLSGLGTPGPRETPPENPAEPRPPVVLIPGFALNRGTLRLLALYLRRCGWRWVHAVNNPIDRPIPELAQALGRQVDALRAASGADQVDLVGHSMGGVVAAWYVNELGGAAHVRRIVSLGTPWRGTRVHVFGWWREAADLAPGSEVLARSCPPRVPTTSIWSPTDSVVLPPDSSDAPGLRSVRIPHVGHLDLLLRGRVWRAVGEALAAPDPVAPSRLADGAPAGHAPALPEASAPAPAPAGAPEASA